MQTETQHRALVALVFLLPMTTHSTSARHSRQLICATPGSLSPVAAGTLTCRSLCLDADTVCPSRLALLRGPYTQQLQLGARTRELAGGGVVLTCGGRLRGAWKLWLR